MFKIKRVLGLLVLTLLVQNLVSAQSLYEHSTGAAPTIITEGQGTQNSNFTNNEEVKAFMTQETVKAIPAD